MTSALLLGERLSCSVPVDATLVFHARCPAAHVFWVVMILMVIWTNGYVANVYHVGRLVAVAIMMS